MRSTARSRCSRAASPRIIPLRSMRRSRAACLREPRGRRRFIAPALPRAARRMLMSESAGHENHRSEDPSSRARDTTRPVILIGFQEQTNLGLGYLASVLRRYGYKVVVFDFELDRAEILRAAKALDPIVIGFSLIFQFYVDRFRELSDYLRDNGVTCHFTMGGHFPSLSTEQTFALVPAMDSIVRYEGEMTLLELADRLGTAE